MVAQHGLLSQVRYRLRKPRSVDGVLRHEKQYTAYIETTANRCVCVCIVYTRHSKSCTCQVFWRPPNPGSPNNEPRHQLHVLLGSFCSQADTHYLAIAQQPGQPDLGPTRMRDPFSTVTLWQSLTWEPKIIRFYGEQTIDGGFSTSIRLALSLPECNSYMLNDGLMMIDDC